MTASIEGRCLFIGVRGTLGPAGLRVKVHPQRFEGSADSLVRALERGHCSNVHAPIILAMSTIALVIIALIPIAVVAFILLNAKTKFELELSQAAYSSGENIEGSITIAAGGEVPAERLVVTLIGVYEETRRKPRSTVGYDEKDDEWDTTSTEVFRCEEELPIELPVAKGFKGEIPFSFAAPLGQQVSVKTPAGGIKQGAEIPEGELVSGGFASLNWTFTAALEGSKVEPELRMLGITLG